MAAKSRIRLARSQEAALMAAFAACDTDARLRTLPIAARGVWLHLAYILIRRKLGTLTVPRAAAHHTDLAAVVQVPALEFVAHLDALTSRGLTVRDPDGGLTLPLVQRHFAKRPRPGSAAGRAASSPAPIPERSPPMATSSMDARLPVPSSTLKRDGELV